MKSLFTDTVYAIACRHIKAGEELLFEGNEAKAFQKIKNDWRYWYADPFVFRYQGNDWLFAEVMDRLTHKGVIAAAPIVNGKVGAFQTVLSESYHLSYPMIFEKGGELFMIPESTAGKCVKLYVCKHFPNQWECQSTLFEEVLYTDSNMVFDHGHWFFITGEMDPNIGAKTKTLVFAADEVENGKLVLLNCADAFSFEQRGAGAVFEHRGNWIRPIQCGSETQYGKSLKFSELNSENPFEETIFAEVQTNQIILPGFKKEISGVHTYAIGETLEIIDIQYNCLSNLPVVFGKVWRKCKRFAGAKG